MSHIFKFILLLTLIFFQKLFSQNLVVNGDFSLGNTGFSTNYTYCNTGGCLFPYVNSAYSVGTNPNFFHSAFFGADHTTGTGNMMIFNGGITTYSAWNQTISVLPSHTYSFSIWACSVYTNNIAQLNFSINGVSIGTLTPSNTYNTWTQFSTTWNSNTSNTAVIRVNSLNTTGSNAGVDFGLDDIEFYLQPTSTACTGVLTGTGMGICNQYSFAITPSQTITPLNYGSQGYACTGVTMPDVSFNIMGGSWRIAKHNWNFTATTSGQISGFDGSGTFHIIPFLASNTITPLSYSGSFVQFAINGTAAGIMLNQTTFSISLSQGISGSGSFSYCPTTSSNVAISPLIPASGGPWTYNWQPGNVSGNPINVSPAVNTNYTVTATTSAGCTSTANVAVTVTCVTTPTSPSCPGSLLLDAAHPSVNLPSSNQYYSGTNGGYTWECWFKLNQPFGSASKPLISSLDGVVFEDQWLGFGWQGGWFDEPVNKLVFKVDGPNSTAPSGPNCSYAPPGGFIIGTWYHAAGVMNYATQTSKLFVNGVLVDSKTILTPPITRTIASALSINSLPLFGNMDEIRIWTRALSDNEVMSNYDQCLFGNEPGLLLYYRCNQPGGSTVIDETANNITGTFPNTPGWSTDQPAITGPACISGTTLTAFSNCMGNNTATAIGTITTTVISPVVSYTWSNSAGIVSQTSNTSSLVDSVANLANGIYTLSIQMTTPCGIITNSQTVNISCCNQILTPSITIINASCTSGTGSVTINSVINGTPNYIIKEGGTTLISGITLPYTISGVSVGTHTYSISNSNGCSVTFTAFVQQSGLPPDLAIASPVQLDCVNETTLTATTTSGATSFSWTGPNILSGATTQSVIVNQIGNYSVTLTQGVCTNSAVVSVIPNINTPTITVIPVITSICRGTTATLTAFGAASYTWNSSATLSGSSGSSVVANPSVTTSYSVIGSLNSCTNIAVTTVSVLPTPTIVLSADTSICEGTGAVILTAAGANSYSWSNSSSLSSPTGSIVIATPGITTAYTVTGSSNTCTNSAIVTVSVNPSPTITAVSLINTTCGLANGSATVSSLPLNTTYIWSSGVPSVTNTAYSLAGGNYSITAINGSCATNTVISILSSVPLLITSSIIVPSNCDANNGSISVTDNLAGSSYAWNTGISTTGVINNLASGNYSLTVTNGACNTSTVFFVGITGGPTDVNLLTTKDLCRSANGSITIGNIVNGIPPYLFSLNNSGFSTNINYQGLTRGTYTLIVKDANGCLFSETVIIADTTLKSLIGITINAPNCMANDGSFFVDSVYGGSAPYLLSFNYAPYSTKNIFEPLGPGTYTLSVMDSIYCKTDFVLTMPESNGEHTLYIPNSFTPNKDKLNDVWYIQGTCLGEINCTLYNRWGEKIAEFNDISKGWDGTYKGSEVPDGVYIYTLKAQTQMGTINKVGHITLFR